MSMRLEQSPKARPEARPQMILANRLLQLSSLELERAVAQELAENPALELVEGGRCSVCGALFSGERCPICAFRGQEREWERPLPEGYDRGGYDEEWDPLSQLPSPTPLSEYLLWQMRPHLKPHQLAIAQYLVESLDDHGLLVGDPEELASLAEVSQEEMEEVLAILQEQEPLGVGARDVRECLLIQLRFLEGEGVEEPLARALLEEHWDHLGKGRWKRMANSLGVGREEIEEALDFIRRNLNPYPAQAYQPSERPDFIRPDVIISTRGDGFHIEIPEEERYQFRINALYQELLAGSASGLDSQEREHLYIYVSRARLFINSFRQRWRTLRRIMAALVEEQRGFLTSGVQHLQPLSRAELAQILGLHESTVSRAVAQKYAQAPEGRIIPLADFFDASLRAKELIKGLISQENTPLSDGEIAKELAKEGIPLARRTVAKYRESLGILPANLRWSRKGR